jgi:hypothetical protein
MNTKRPLMPSRLPVPIQCAFVLLTLLAALSVQAREFYVNQQHPQSADTAAGTREAPLKTISAAAKMAQAGDTVVVAAGIYRESVKLTNSGAAGKPIVFQSETKHQAFISGADVLRDPRDEGAEVYSYPIAKVHPVAYLGGNPQWVYLNGLPLERAETPDRLIPGSFYLDMKNQRVHVALPEDEDITKVTLEYACREGLFAAEKPIDDIHLQGFTLQHTANWFRGHGPILATGQRWLVEDNHVRWTSYGGVKVTNSNACIVRNNLIEWAGCDGAGGGFNVDLLFEGNTVRYNNWRSFEWGMEGGGSKFSCTIDCRYAGNVFAYNYGPGLWTDAAATGTIYEKNICHDNSARSLFSEINWDEVIQDNICYNTSESGIGVSNGPGMVIRRNVIFNNAIGISLSGNYTRPNDHDQKWYPSAIVRMAGVPGLSRHRAVLWDAGFLKNYVAPKATLNNNCVIWENLIFDNGIAMMEQRDYRKPSPTDAFVNSFSDYNTYWAASEKQLFSVGYTNPYESLEAWRKASARDEHSQIANPRDPATKLPDWAQACRKDWDIKMRSIFNPAGVRDDNVRQQFYSSPMAQIAMGRMLRSPFVEPVKLSDKRVRAAVFDHEGQRTLALWTTQPAERCYVRLRLDQAQVIMENGYLAQKNLSLADGSVDVLVTYNPTYLRGIGEKFVESPSGIIQVPAFNIAGQPIAATATFVNEGMAGTTLKAAFKATAGFTITPASIEKEIALDEKIEIKLTLVPDGSVSRGTGMIRMNATLGDARIRRTAVFTTGSGDSKVPHLTSDIQIDGQLDDWGSIAKDAVPIATINDVSQYLAGPKDAWKGPGDLSARLYAAWKKDALHLAVVVHDDKVISASGNTNEWGTVQFDKCDAVSLSLDGRAPDMQWQKELNQGTYDATISPAADGKPILRPNGKASGSIQGVVAATTVTATGYTIEMMIPLTEKNFPAQQWQRDRPIKLSLLIADSDDPKSEAPRKALGWSVSPDQKNSEDTSGWATLVLDETK